jgi:PAS domain S-box-containing protein
MLLTSRFEMWLGWGPDLFFFYNDAYIPTLGIKHPAMLAKPLWEVWPEVYPDLADQVERVRQGEATWNQAMLLLLERSGFAEETYHSFSYSPLHGGDGAVQGLLCIVREETERIVGERRLETLRKLGMGLVRAQSHAAVREAVCAAFDANREDFPFALGYLPAGAGGEGFSCSDDAKPLLAAEWPIDGAGLRRSRMFHLKGGLDYPTGPWAIPPREALAVPVPGPGEQSSFGFLVLGLNPYRRDGPGILDFASLIAGQISGALAILETLNAERRRADRIWTHGRDLMVVIDAEGVFRSVSPAWTRILGHSPAEVVGRHLRDFVAAEDEPMTADAHTAAINNTELTGFENRLRARNGELRWISWHTALEDELVYAYGRDITEQKQNAEALAVVEDALRQAQKMEAVGQLTGGLAHDFNNLLAGISGSLELVKTRITQGRIKDVERYIDSAQGATKRAAALTHRLLAFSRQQTLAPRPTDINALVSGMLDLIQRTVGPSIRVEFVGMVGLWVAFVDSSQLENALLNLCINARDAMPEGGVITIETANRWIDQRGAKRQDIPEGQYLSLCVSDTGTGMPPDVIAKAFDPFFTTKPIGQGTGLGLSMIYGFANQSGGQARIYSEVGRGTMVCIYLPRHRGEAEAAEVAADTGIAPCAEAGETVLIVDDEPGVRMLVTEVLEDLRYTAIEASDSRAGLRVLQSDARVDLLITDVGLPGGMNGRQMADAARVSRPDLKVIFITGFAENALLNNGQIEPGMSVLTKPFAMDTLAARIRELIAK